MKSTILHRRESRISPSGFYAVFLATTLGLTSLVTACGDSSAKPAQGPSGVPVKLQVARSTTFNDTTDYVATLKSRDSAVIMPQVEGIITQIFVRSGQKVGAGAPLIQIDPAKQQATFRLIGDSTASTPQR